MLPKIKTKEIITLDNYTEDHMLYVKELQREFQKDIQHDIRLNSTWFLLRFLNARNFDIEKTKKVFKESLEFKKTKNLDRVAQTKFDDEFVQKLMPRGFYYQTKEGHPVFINPISQYDFKTLSDRYADKIEILEDFFIQFQERIVNIVLPKASEASNKRIDKMFVVIDLKNIGIKILTNKKIKQVLGIATRITQNNYPELLYKLIIVNAPYIFKAFFQAIKVILDKRTVAKISIESGDGIKIIQQYINLDYFPIQLGGNCDIPIYENPGPWQTSFQDSVKNQTLKLSNELIFNKFYLTPKEQRRLEEHYNQNENYEDKQSCFKQYQILGSIVMKENIQLQKPQERKIVKVNFPKNQNNFTLQFK